jgi:hypothetical protein
MRHLLAWTLVTAAALAAAPTAQGAPAHPNCPRLSGTWYGANRAHLQQVIDERGTCSRTGGHPVAVFDWNNTVTKNDVTDATLAWTLKHDKILRPAHWSGGTGRRSRAATPTPTSYSSATRPARISWSTGTSGI